MFVGLIFSNYLNKASKIELLQIFSILFESTDNIQKNAKTMEFDSRANLGWKNRL